MNSSVLHSKKPHSKGSVSQDKQQDKIVVPNSPLASGTHHEDTKSAREDSKAATGSTYLADTSSTQRGNISPGSRGQDEEANIQGHTHEQKMERIHAELEAEKKKLDSIETSIRAMLTAKQQVVDKMQMLKQAAYRHMCEMQLDKGKSVAQSGTSRVASFAPSD